MLQSEDKEIGASVAVIGECSIHNASGPKVMIHYIYLYEV
jgi:hypothetical protein